MKDKEAIKLLGGILFAFVLVKILKRIIKQSRPIKSETLGMPSSRSTIMAFIVVFLLLNYKFKDETKILLFLFTFLTVYIKYYLKEHSFNQLVVGFILGTIIAYIVNNF
tara:strand:+ start:248 stop:574 length:327 start_codon:yes stop_codon:yes gene_type:complete